MSSVLEKPTGASILPDEEEARKDLESALDRYIDNHLKSLRNQYADGLHALSVLTDTPDAPDHFVEFIRQRVLDLFLIPFVERELIDSNALRNTTSTLFKVSLEAVNKKYLQAKLQDSLSEVA